jgi:hypothetical protein
MLSKYIKFGDLNIFISAWKYIRLKAEHFIVTNRHTFLQETELTWQIINRPHLSVLCVYENIKRSSICGHNILIEGVFVTQMSSNVGISVWRILWIMT